MSVFSYIGINDLIIASSLVLLLFALLMLVPTGVVLWFVGPTLGIITVALSALGKNTLNIPDLLNCMYAKKLSDLYLLATVTSAMATADGFELAWLLAPSLSRNASMREKVLNRIQSVWVVLFTVNLCFLIYITILASKMMVWQEISRDALTNPRYVIWYYIFLSIAFGVIFRWRLEIEKAC